LDYSEEVEGNMLNRSNKNSDVRTTEEETRRIDTIQPEQVQFADPNLAAAVRNEIGKSEEHILKSDLEGLTKLDARSRQITYLNGIEHCANLKMLNLADNHVNDIIPLSSLTKLQFLNLYNNRVIDITPLSNLTKLDNLTLDINQISNISSLIGLTNLKMLSLGDTQISDISSLSKLINLEWLDLYNSQIRDISPLRRLTKLWQLNLQHNQIKDVSPLNSLTNLQHLSLLGNQISDISPLGSLTKLRRLFLYFNRVRDINPLNRLSNLRTLYLAGNQIIDISPLSKLTELQELYLMNNQISDISSLAKLTDLELLYLDSNRIQDISILEVLTKIGREDRNGWRSERNVGKVHLGFSGNQISDISPLIRNSGIGDGVGVDLRGNPLNDEAHEVHIPVLQERGVSLLYNPKPSGEMVTFLDKNLQEAARDSLVVYDRPIYESDLEGLKVLSAWGKNVRDLNGVENCINLENLGLGGNQISDISPLSGLTNLQWLSLERNQINDISPLVSNSSIGAGVSIHLKGNPLNDEAYKLHIPALQERDVEVGFAPKT